MMSKSTPIGPGEIPPAGLDDVQMLDGAVDRPPYLMDCLVVRVLEGGRLLAVRPQLFTAQLCVGTAERLSEPMGAWDDVWDYETCLQALLGLAAWQPGKGEAEPTGWIRHPRSCRRRRHGDPEQEEVRA